MPLLLIVWSLAELFVIVEVAEHIGFLWMLVGLLASGPIGLSVMRHEGAGALARVRLALTEGRSPGPEIVDGGLILGGGLALMFPGFLLDVVGAVLLVRPCRKLAAKGLAGTRAVKWLELLSGWSSRFTGTSTPFSGTGARRQYDAEATAHDNDERHLER